LGLGLIGEHGCCGLFTQRRRWILRQRVHGVENYLETVVWSDLQIDHGILKNRSLVLMLCSLTTDLSGVEVWTENPSPSLI